MSLPREFQQELAVWTPWLEKMKPHPLLVQENLIQFLACVAMYHYEQSTVKLFDADEYVAALAPLHPSAVELFMMYAKENELGRWISSFTGLIARQELNSKIRCNQFMEKLERKRRPYVTPNELAHCLLLAERLQDALHALAKEPDISFEREEIEAVLAKTKAFCKGRSDAQKLFGWDGVQILQTEVY